MKKFYLFLTFLVAGLAAQAAPAAGENTVMRNYGDAYIFVERGVEFAVFPDGQFDFFFNSRRNFKRIPAHINYSFNSGYNYGPFVQYDDYGAVIQIESVPVYYDYYGRIIQAGRVHIRYNAFGMVSRIGNMFMHYNPYQRLSHTSGFINGHNPYYVYRPWHDHYMRPHSHMAVVYHQPYRLYYSPERMRYNQYKRYYHTNYRNNEIRRSYYQPGERVTAYHRGRRVETPREVRQEVSTPARATASVEQRRTESRRSAVRSAATSNDRVVPTRRTSRVETPQAQYRDIPQARSSRVEAPTMTREMKQQTRSTVNNSSQREVQVQSRRSEPSTPARVETAPRVRTPEAVSTRGSRTSRVRE